MTDIQAAVGREQLKRLPEIVATRRALAERYRDAARGHPGPAAARASPSGRAATGRATACGCPTAAISARSCSAMLDDGDRDAPRHHVHAIASPATRGSAAPGALPHSEAAQEHCIILPLYPQMTRDDQEQVADALQRACAR